METAEKLTLLRNGMAKAGMDAYIICSGDSHGSEYSGAHFRSRAYISGFTGSAGTLVVTEDRAALWTDGRYFIQAAAQLRGSGIELMKIGQPNVPTTGKYLADILPEGAVIGFDGKCVTNAFVKELEKCLSGKETVLKYDTDLIDAIWDDRPALPAEPVWEMDIKYCGESREDKLRRVREKMTEKQADFLVITALDAIAWLLNLRGNDIPSNPVFMSYMIIAHDTASLFVQEKILSAEIKEKLRLDNIAIKDYDDIYSALSSISHGTVWLDGGSANYRIKNCISGGVEVIDEQSPITLMKAIKNKTEMENMRKAHIEDGVAVTRFIHWLKTNAGKERITELSAAERLLEFRKEMDGFIEPSFGSIIGYAHHGAIVHYSATPETNIEIKPKGLCLADTGGHYHCGTTDITRTIVMGELTEEERDGFTTVLRGNLNLAAARFPHGCSGDNLDAIAHMPLWEKGMDYNHGTGHGVGFVLNVHEGPASFSRKQAAGAKRCVLEEGMVLSDEPGLYIEGKFGVRHENLVLVRKGEKNEYGEFMYLEPLTMVPFDLDGVNPSLMSDRERELLNNYHREVFEKISPYFEGEELDWLRNATRAI